MALSWLKRICAKIKQRFDEYDENMKRWREEDPDSYFAFMEEQENWWQRGGL